MQPSKDLVIGGGIAGLVYALYNPECTVVTDKIGGQFSAPFQLGPKYLHITEKTEKYISDIGLSGKVKTKTVRVGFYYDGKINPHNTEENRRQYFEKTRGVGIAEEVYRSAMSGGDEEFGAFDVDVEELINATYEKVKDRVIIDRIKIIDLFFKRANGDNGTHEFDNLIVTIPKPIFCYMIGQTAEAREFVSYPTTFIREDLSYDDIVGVNWTEEDFKDYDYVYVSDKKVPFHRVTKITNDFCYEYKGVYGVDDGFAPEDRYVLKIGQLIQRNDTISYPPYVKFFGRYAQWMHGIKTKELLEELIK